ncbi:uncharacterized protein SPPG_03184 [Spizellomyces punctatus DAOM BR117]|uniref:Uncharacterized protein n=1 Tax=Spizellomyces punctatus (strain DAOM BR117) TaxID=645134 RepID=A0A0L0HIT5_SPIPD|nr:uncharacterized protein SPPG_03184 [Spizellomyces punctatus DAOM BR117]KND01371.1 hypothetical protein SPPG_03184 [Spizellomyces punctatus DAOM BR117]|eukprot:XP_016609410.1 hypothetical protein SPPG_03184 [Spizellomyces punctatus DAOM BR117]
MSSKPNVPPNEDTLARTAHFLCKTSLPWQSWKETEPELFWFFERHFRAWSCSIKLTADDKTFLVSLDLPNDHVGKIERAIKDGVLAMELDKMHGIDPALSSGRRDVKISKFQVSMAPAQPQNLKTKHTMQGLEQRLLELELRERARSIDLRVIMDRLQSFQVDIYKRLEGMEKKVDDTLAGLAVKCDKMEKVVARYKK